MKKYLFLIFVLTFSNIFIAQTKIETEKWISEKIKLFGLKSNEVENDYSLIFNNGIIKVIHTTKINNRIYTINSDITIKDISSFLFIEEKEVILLRIQTNNNSKIKSNFNNEIKFLEYYDFRLNKSFKDNDLIKRMTKALNNLIKFNGGKIEAY